MLSYMDRDNLEEWLRRCVPFGSRLLSWRRRLSSRLHRSLGQLGRVLRLVRRRYPDAELLRLDCCLGRRRWVSGGERREPIARVHFPLQLRRSLEQLERVLRLVRRRYNDADLLRLKSRLGGRRRVPDGERCEPIQLVHFPLLGMQFDWSCARHAQHLSLDSCPWSILYEGVRLRLHVGGHTTFVRRRVADGQCGVHRGH